MVDRNDLFTQRVEWDESKHFFPPQLTSFYFNVLKHSWKLVFQFLRHPTKRLLILGMDRSGSIDKYLLNIKENCKKLFEKSTQMVLQWVGETISFFVTGNRIVQKKKKKNFCSFFLSGYFLSLDCCLKLLTHIGIDVNGARYAKAEREKYVWEYIDLLP